jgi:hypothetical protein
MYIVQIGKVACEYFSLYIPWNVLVDDKWAKKQLSDDREGIYDECSDFTFRTIMLFQMKA